VGAARAVEIVGAERATDMSIGAGTKVQLVSPASLPTLPATAVVLMSTVPIASV